MPNKCRPKTSPLLKRWVHSLAPVPPAGPKGEAIDMHGVPRSTLAAAMSLALLAGCQALPGDQLAQAAVAGAHAALAEAYSTCNEAAFLGAYADQFTFTTSNTPGAIVHRRGLQAYLAYGCGLTPNPTATVKQQSIRFTTGQAVVTGQYLFRVPSAGKVVDVVQNFTAVFGQEGGGWKLVVHHVSVAP